MIHDVRALIGSDGGARTRSIIRRTHIVHVYTRTQSAMLLYHYCCFRCYYCDVMQCNIMNSRVRVKNRRSTGNRDDVLLIFFFFPRRVVFFLFFFVFCARASGVVLVLITFSPKTQFTTPNTVAARRLRGPVGVSMLLPSSREHARTPRAL